MARILLVDDEDHFRALLRKVLEREGHEVIEASDGPTGVALYREKPADLLITDLAMPGKTGIDVIKELRRDFPDIKIIAISGGGPQGNFDYLAAANRIGAQHTFLKPVKNKELLAAIKELLPA